MKRAANVPEILFPTLLALLAAACSGDAADLTAPEPDGPNRAPVAVGSIPAVTVAVGETVVVDAAAYFSDPDGDGLSYAAVSSDPALATVAVAGSAVTVAGVAKGTATVTVTASDGGGGTAQQAFAVAVPNRAPEVVGSTPAVTVAVGETVVVDAAAYFSDPDSDGLSYAAVSSDPALATVAVAGSTVTVTGVAKGAATVTVTASDGGGGAAQQAFEVTIPNRAPVAVGSLPAVTVALGETAVVDAAAYFSDPDGDGLSYAVVSSDRSRVTVAPVAGSTVTVAGVGQGTATVTVTASDGDGGAAHQAFAVTVPNRPPEVTAEGGDVVLEVGGAAWDVNLIYWFSDPDGDRLAYAATTSDVAIATASVSGNTLTIAAGVAPGTATVTVTAADPGGLTARATVAVTVSGDRAALEAFYHATGGPGGPGWTGGNAGVGWLSDRPLGEWNAVTTGPDGRVTGLDKNNSRLSGRIPPELGYLSSLEYLNLFANNLTGPIPPEIGNLTALRTLLLGSNRLSGPIPPEIGNLTRLEELRLGSNRLTGPIPPEIGNLTAVEVLHLNRNALSGPIPPEIGKLGALEWLLLNLNALSGPIPPELGGLTALRTLYLTTNRLSGPIPPELSNLRWLRDLDLEDNRLTGPIPPELGSLVQLEGLDLRRNRLTGPIPPELGSLALLDRLVLSYNDLSGSIPPKLGDAVRIRGLFLNNNAGLSGPLPFTMTRLSLVREIDLLHTGLCVPNTPAFRDWINNFRGGVFRRQFEWCQP